jgi:hypothetical protein
MGDFVTAGQTASQVQLPDSDLYIIYSISNSPYQQWMADLLDFSIRQVGQPGEIVRLCSLEVGGKSAVKPSAHGYTFTTPSYAKVGNAFLRHLMLMSKRLLGMSIHGRYHFYCLNKAYATKTFLASHPDLDDKALLLWMDPDMVFNRAWIPPASKARPGHVTGQRWWTYKKAWCHENGGSQGPLLCPTVETAIMYPYCITVGDMRAIVEPYCRISEAVYMKTGNWESEMYGHVMAMEKAGLQCHGIGALGTCNNWPDGLPDEPSAPISHYCQGIKNHEGQEIWSKWNYTDSTTSLPWQRPPPAESAATLTDQRTLQMLHQFIDWQEKSGHAD